MASVGYFEKTQKLDVEVIYKVLAIRHSFKWVDIFKTYVSSVMQ
jgi:hypothetical protein